MAWTSKIAVLACALIVISCAYVYYDINGGSLDPTNRQLVLVTTDSMDGDVTDYDIDSFPANTLVMVEHLSDYEKKFIRVGDVISYDNGHVLVQHRVVEVHNGVLYVHGDNNNSTQVVSSEDVNGRIIGTSWILGHALSFISDHFLLFLLFMFVLSASAAAYGVYSVPKSRWRGTV